MFSFGINVYVPSRARLRSNPFGIAVFLDRSVRQNSSEAGASGLIESAIYKNQFSVPNPAGVFFPGGNTAFS